MLYGHKCTPCSNHLILLIVVWWLVSATRAAIILLAIGSAFIGMGVYAFRLYRSTFRADPKNSISRDLMTVMMLGSLATPPLLAGILFYLGGLCLLLFLYIVWFEIVR